MNKLSYINWLNALKLSKPTRYYCKNCNSIIYNYMPINGHFCFNCRISSLNFKEMVEYHTENGFEKIKPILLKTQNKCGLNKYFEDLEKWENSFYCNECGCDERSDFYYTRSVANGDVYVCRKCKTETVFGNKPNEDNY